MEIFDYYENLRNKQSPIVKQMKKMGTVSIGTVETTPVVWQNKLLRFEWVRTCGSFSEAGHQGGYRFVDMSDESAGPVFGRKHAFGCCHAEDDTMYVYGVRGESGGTNVIDVLWSRDLENWQEKTAVVLQEDLKVFNTSVCKGENGYIMAIEIDGNREIVGHRFTIIFARSDNLFDWELLSLDRHVYDASRYTACPVIRYCDGFYYMISLEEMPMYRFVPYITRTRDFEHFEMGVRNPVMFFSDEDKQLLDPERFTEAEKELILNAGNNNNSDVDLCEYQGKTYVLYSWGNQLGKEYLALGIYDGSMEEYLKSFF